jgi:hypothetical protein
MSRFQTDSLNPSALPSAILGQRRRPQQTTSNTFLRDGQVTNLPLGERNDIELDKVAEAWNVRIDKDVKAVVGGLKEIVTMADVSVWVLGTSCLPPYRYGVETLSLSLRHGPGNRYLGRC